jgi:alpha-tubulin suppressor-like RCC1 family protein
LFSLGAKSCIGRGSNKTKSGSSIPEWSLSAPSGLSATAVSFSEIQLTWQDNSSEDGFEIWRYTFPDTQYSLLTTIPANTTSYSDTGLSLFTIYYYRVRAFNAIGDLSEWANEISANTLSPVWSAVAAGESHTLALTTNGTVWTWGRNDYWQLALGDTMVPDLVTTTISPTRIDLSWSDNFDETNFRIERSVNSNDNYSALTTTNTDVIWYSDTTVTSVNTYYYRVWAYISDRTTPSLIEFDAGWNLFENIKAVVASQGPNGYSLALKTDGTLWGWGANGVGQLGVGWIETPNVPTQVGLYSSDGFLISADSDWAQIAAGQSHSLGIKTNGTLWAWGNNAVGQLGDPNITNPAIPNKIGTDSDWSKVTGGFEHTIAIKRNGTIWTWGDNTFGQLGDGTLTPLRFTPTKIGTDSDWSVASGGRYHTLAIKTNGTIWEWGSNGNGELGLGYTSSYSVIPVQIGSNSDWSAIAAGNRATIACKTNGTLWSWGWNISGALGLGDTVDRWTPTQVGSVTNWFMIAIAACGQHSVGLKISGTLWAWGKNDYGQLGFGDTIERLIPITFGSPNPPSPPFSLTATVISSSRIDLSWSQDSYNENGFIIERSVNTNTNYSSIATVGYNIVFYSNTTGIVPNTTYYYRVKAYNEGGNSSYSNEISVSTIMINAPSSLIVTAISSTQISLSWIDNSDNEDGFEIERSCGSPGAYIQIDTIGPVNLPITTAIYADTTVAPGNTYYYRVRAYNNIDNSSYSNETNATTTPSVPMALTATAISLSQIDLVWTDVSGENGYEIERSLTPATGYFLIATTGSDVTLYSDTVLTPGTTFYYQVRAYNDSGNSNYSPEANATTLSEAPSTPTLLNTTAISTTLINLLWTDIGGETGYKIERSFATTSTYLQITTVGSNSVSYSDTTVTPSNTYYYRIRAYNIFGDSPYSNVLSTTTISPLHPLSGDIPPAQFSEYSTTAGYRFSSDVNGYITALGRYIGSGTGNTTVILWDNTGTELGRVTVSGEPGWQWANLVSPIYITKDTPYRVSVSCSAYWWYQDFSLPIIRGNINISSGCLALSGLLDVFPETLDNGVIDGLPDIEFVAE